VESKQELVYVDIPGKAIHRYIPSTGEDYSFPTDGRPTLIVPFDGDNNKYLIAHERDLQVLEWDGVSSTPTSFKTIATVEEDRPKNRFNDGKCDPHGRLWAGTMGYETTPGAVEPERGNLYSLGLGGELNKQVDKIGISNGLAWSSDGSKFFYIDSVAYSVDVFDYDVENGTVSNRRVLFDLKKNGIAGLPDGMCTDANNNIWVAVYTGGKILHIDSTTGALKETIDLSGKTSKPTSVTFGGPNLDELYVTSANFGLSPEQLAAESDPGALLKITGLGVKGISGGVNYKGNLH
jgi:gluconolactonase